MTEFPYKAEYAKSGRASCKGCKLAIGKDSLRLAAMVQSRFHDAKDPNWFHFQCFWRKNRPASEGDIESFESLRVDDQKKIRDEIAELSGVVVPTEGKKKKRKAGEALALKDYGVEYASSGRAGCRGCEQKISKDEIRIKKVVYDTEVGMKWGGQPLWHHVDCFAKLRDELGYFEAGDKLPGYRSLSKEDQQVVKKALPAVMDVPEKKVKKEDVKKEEMDEVDSSKRVEEEKKYAKQNQAFYKLRDALKDNLTKRELSEILDANDQRIPEGVDRILDRLADIMLFGALLPCTKCKKGQLVFDRGGYKCHGNLTEWVKCENLIKEPERRKTVIPNQFKEAYPFLKSYKSKVSVRIIPYVAPTVVASTSRVKKDETDSGPRIQREKPPLYNMQFVIVGHTERSKDDIKALITKLGGKVSKTITATTAAIISNKEEVEKMNKRMQEAKELQIQVVPEDFLDVAKDGGAVSYITSKAICDWGSDPHSRIPQEETKSRSKSIYSAKSKSVTLKLKGGTAVDPDSGLDDEAHVYKEGSHVFNAVLGLTDIQSGKNSYYKLQILESDKGNRYWVFRSWGRIGTIIGNTKLENCSTKYEAVKIFKELYEEKSGNMWDYRHDFTKYPGKYYPVDIDYGEDEPVKRLNTESKIPSKLQKPVQDLVALIFDVDQMKKTMMELELDTGKMPLGRLSKSQLKKAYGVLNEISELIANSGSNEMFIDASNRFYTLVPHDFGVDTPPLLDTVDEIKAKIQMLDSLMEIEFAYSMLNEETDDQVNPIDGHFEQLRVDMESLDHDSEDFKLIQTYVKNTHAETHKQYELEVQEVFKVSRKGEEKRFKPFKKLHNRKLLWHGSRLTNYAGILGHGLKIAPPEAPFTGYMFGKGIYFADMVSKSANYCFTSAMNSTGLVLLCEVALGDMEQYKDAHYVTKLPAGKHSVKGLGATYPNPAESVTQPDGVEIPLGKPITDPKLRSGLLYNEYIVYDVAQVKCQYLLKLNFNYKY